MTIRFDINNNNINTKQERISKELLFYHLISMSSRKKITFLLINTNNSVKHKKPTFNGTLSACNNLKTSKSNKKYKKYCISNRDWTNRPKILPFPAIFFQYYFSFVFILFILNLFTNTAIVGLVIVHGAELNLSLTTNSKTVQYEFNVKPSLPITTSNSFHLSSIDGKWV